MTHLKGVIMGKQAQIMKFSLCFTLGLVVWRLIDTYLFLDEGLRFSSNHNVHKAVTTGLDLLLISLGLFVMIRKTSNAAERYLWLSFTFAFAASFVMSIAEHIPFPIGFLFGVEAVMVTSLWAAFVLWRKHKNTPKEPA